MTNKENMKKVIMDDFYKNKNHNNIIKLIEENKKDKKYYKYVIVPACLVLLLIIGFVLTNNNTNNRFQKSINNDSDSDSLIRDNNIQINYLKQFNNDDNKYQVFNYFNVPYYEILSGLLIPDDFDNKDYYQAVGIPAEVGDDDFGKINNYEYWCFNTTNNRRIIIAYSDKNIPLRNKDINIKNQKSSSINGLDIQIYNYKNIFISKFNYGGFNFSIESRDISQDEFISLIESIIK